MKKSLAAFLFFGLFITITANSYAIPNYARNMNLDCGVCHSVRPQLGSFGQQYLRSGGKPLNTKKYGKVDLATNFYGGRLKSEWLDKRFSADSTMPLIARQKELRIRPVSEGQIFLSGRVASTFYYSLFTTDTNFDLGLPKAYILQPLSENMRLYGGYASPFAIDGYDTVSHRKILRREWSAADFVPGTGQMIGVQANYNEVTGTIVVHGDEGDSQGRDPESLSARFTYGKPSYGLGIYYTAGHIFDGTAGESPESFQLYGLDGTFRLGDLNLIFLAGFRKFRGETVNNLSLEVNYIFGKLNIRPFKAIIPIISIDTFKTRGNGGGRFVQAALGAVLRVNSNFRFVPSVEGTIKAPNGFVNKDFRITLSGDLAF